MNLFSVKRYIFIFAIFSVLCLGTNACKTSESLENKTKLTKEGKTVITLENKDANKNNLKYEQAVKAHYKNQSETTKMMMKDAKKQQRRNNRIHKRSLWDILFRRSCK